MKKYGFEEFKKNWDKFGKSDPLYAILGSKQVKNKYSFEDFMLTGYKEIDELMDLIRFMEVDFKRNIKHWILLWYWEINNSSL